MFCAWSRPKPSKGIFLKSLRPESTSRVTSWMLTAKSRTTLIAEIYGSLTGCLPTASSYNTAGSQKLKTFPPISTKKQKIRGFPALPNLTPLTYPTCNTHILVSPISKSPTLPIVALLTTSSLGEFKSPSPTAPSQIPAFASTQIQRSGQINGSMEVSKTRE